MANALLIAAGDETRPGRRAGRSVCVEVGEPDAVSGQRVDVRSFDVRRPVAPKVPITDVVGDDEHDVRACRVDRPAPVPKAGRR